MYPTCVSSKLCKFIQCSHATFSQQHNIRSKLLKFYQCNSQKKQYSFSSKINLIVYVRAHPRPETCYCNFSRFAFLLSIILVKLFIRFQLSSKLSLKEKTLVRRTLKNLQAKLNSNNCIRFPGINKIYSTKIKTSDSLIK